MWLKRQKTNRELESRPNKLRLTTEWYKEVLYKGPDYELEVRVSYKETYNREDD